ncbi:glycosyltransferase family 2 protein [uncultured Bacteroides sp.]|jgi:Glycosyltransferases involved in cell wall biogenesis|uniref:glycosyltransferase family 2 protein n=1 Tax=uncultured Bacteroides sp. TaxID=162156 RepID=UPI002676B55B|nr:glycosyltransferase family 2 protein [uncultured Bacteroides sp.]
MIEYPIHVSVIIPVYNAVKYIERCTCSLLGQTLENMEFIFIDDHTPDESMEALGRVIERYPARKRQIKIIHHKSRRGIAAVRNTGLDNAVGEYIGWVDSDDWVDGEMFEKLYLSAVRSGADIAWCDYYVNFPQEEKVRQKLSEDPQALLRAILLENLMTPLWNKIMRRDLFTRYGIRFLDGVDMAEDKNVCIKILGVSSRVKYVPQGFYHYETNNRGSLMHRHDDSHRIDYTLNMIDAVRFVSNAGVQMEKNELIIYKLLSKVQYLYSLDICELRKWSTVFPETNRLVSRCPKLMLRHKITAWMATFHCWWLLRIYLSVYRFKLKIYKR